MEDGGLMKITLKAEGYPEATLEAYRLKMGYKKIIIYNNCGRQVLYKQYDTNKYWDMKINDKPVLTHGEGFKRLFLYDK